MRVQQSFQKQDWYSNDSVNHDISVKTIKEDNN